MKARYVQRGETIDFKNTTESAITANDIVTLTNRIGIAATDIPIGAIGTVHVVGVYDLPAETVNAFTPGQTVYLSNSTVVKDSTSGVVAGYAVEVKPANGTVARVKIG